LSGILKIKTMFTFTGSSRGHDRHHSSGNLRPLGNEELRSLAPSVFAEHAMLGVSDNYSFLPTIHAIDGLRNAGWNPVWVSEQTVRLDTRKGFQKHMIRFQRADLIGKDTEFCPEICLVNSHDRSSAYQIHAGIFRMICGNGLIIADTTFERVSIRHSGFEPSLVVDASLKVVDSLPQLTDAVESFRARRLTPAESKVFAESAILLRYDDLQAAPVSPQKLLEPRRAEDSADNLWTTFNRVQENLIRGGLKDYSRRKADGKRHPRTRAVAGLDENVRLNKALWHLAEALKSHSFPA
jgi:hypothetical protein